ncbi:MAG: site-2 protease family protein [Planctomycetota bacterium]|nr:site-2 protease family protein [Planctomycetota bacterium]
MLKRRLPLHLLSVLVGVPVLAAIPGGSLILAILGISLLIFLHEWGHFYACKLTGTRTETFSIGFGPRLFGWEKDRDGQRRFTVGRRRLDPADHAMDFRVAAIPLGGYVKMAGEIPGEGGDGTSRPPAPDEFPAKSAWARTFIISAGVIMNFLTAIVFYFITIQGEKAFRAPIVGEVSPGGAAWAAGVEPGDRVLEINGQSTPTWIDLQMEIAFSSKDEAAEVIVERGGERKRIDVEPVYDDERGILAFGIVSTNGLQLGEGDDALDIGPQDEVTIGGVTVRGGSRAYTLIRNAVALGKLPLEVTKPGGQRYVLEPRPAKPEEKLEDPGAKVGIGAYAPVHVKATRGRTRDVFAIEDRILAVVQGGKREAINRREDIAALLFTDAIEAFVVERGGNELERPVSLRTREDVVAFLGDLSVDTKLDTRILPLQAGNIFDRGAQGTYRLSSAPALEAGIPPGARVVRVGKVITREFDDIIKALGKAKVGEPMDVTYQTEAGDETTVAVTPAALTSLGVLPITLVEHRERWSADGVGSALAMGAGRTWRETKNVFRTIGALFTGTISFNKNIAGPITLITASKRFAEDSLLRLVWFLAYVSVMLAVLNILPIPVLDGGHLMFILIEKIKGKPLEDETIFRFQKIGFLLLLVLMFFAFKNDFTRLFS